MLLRKTRHIWAQKGRLAVWRVLNIQSALDETREQMLEGHMGFKGQWQEHRRFQLAMIQSLGIAPSSHLLEVGCGPLTLALPLIAYLEPGRYVGIDIRPEVLNLGYGEIGRAGLAAKNPQLVHTQSFGAEELGDRRFDVVWSFSVLYHLSDDLLHALLKQVALRLAPGGQFFANVNASMDESRWLQFPFVRRPVEFYQEAARQAGLYVESLGTIESLGFRRDEVEKAHLMLRFSPRAQADTGTADMGDRRVA